MAYLSNEAPGLIPLTLTNPGNSTGFELIADEGGSPVRVDFINEHRNIAVFGTTRSGKSVLVSGMMTQFLSEGYPIVALDYPKQDGTSTFSDYTSFLPNGAYFDIGREANNIMEKPDLRRLSADEQRERFEDAKSFQEGFLETMVLPNSDDVMLSQTVRSLLGRALTNYYADTAIAERYEAALTGGFGSAAWQATPTLHDFLPFCTAESLGVTDDIGLIRAAQAQILLRLEYWLEDSPIRHAIGRSSSFPSDAQILTSKRMN